MKKKIKVLGLILLSSFIFSFRTSQNNAAHNAILKSTNGNITIFINVSEDSQYGTFRVFANSSEAASEDITIKGTFSWNDGNQQRPFSITLEADSIHASIQDGPAPPSPSVTQGTITSVDPNMVDGKEVNAYFD